MTEQMLPFDAVEFNPTMAREAKEEGLSRAILKNYKERSEILEIARKQARLHARIYGTVSADDIRKYMVSFYPDCVSEYAKIAGHLFKPKSEWECVGSEPSEVVSRHGNSNRKWRLR